MRVKSFLDSFVIRDSNELVLCVKKKKGKKTPISVLSFGWILLLLLLFQVKFMFRYQILNSSRVIV